MNEKRPAIWTMFEDATGGFSIMRVMFAMTTVLILGVWAYVCIISNPPALVTIPKELVGLILGFGGVKTFQRFAEGKEVEAEGTPATTTTTTTTIVKPTAATSDEVESTIVSG